MTSWKIVLTWITVLSNLTGLNILDALDISNLTFVSKFTYLVTVEISQFAPKPCMTSNQSIKSNQFGYSGRVMKSAGFKDYISISLPENWNQHRVIT